MRALNTPTLPGRHPTDPAAGAPDLEALATSADARFIAYDQFSYPLDTPTAIITGGSMGFPFAANSEQDLFLTSVIFDNTGLTGNFTIHLPAYPQRWWWYIGANLKIQVGPQRTLCSPRACT
jgi:hypothetical protein